ncbi:ATP-binding protein [Desulfovibrio cuneatus]|uniref:ATP-binding protein n=1 Tax=Desulfovibrio cuneatus TaxID=159728 RepID=UPI00041A9439|nr:4Fe-4S binding protein [Desulfovibrio cuneatus]
MEKKLRTVISVNKELCIGCGKCVLKCPGGALAIANGKAHVVSDIFCDGLGKCIGRCPTGALTLSQRKVEDYDAVAARENKQAIMQTRVGEDVGQDYARATHKQYGHHDLPVDKHHKHADGSECCGGKDKHHKHADGSECCGGKDKHHEEHHDKHKGKHGHHECCGGKDKHHKHADGSECCGGIGKVLVSKFPQSMAVRPGLAAAMPGKRPAFNRWPVKVRLAPAEASWLQGAAVLVAADCAMAVAPWLHERQKQGEVLLIGCPKLEGKDALHEALTELFRTARPRSVAVARMEVPCCQALVHACTEALEDSGIAVQANILEVVTIPE